MIQQEKYSSSNHRLFHKLQDIEYCCVRGLAHKVGNRVQGYRQHEKLNLKALSALWGFLIKQLFCVYILKVWVIDSGFKITASHTSVKMSDDDISFYFFQIRPVNISVQNRIWLVKYQIWPDIDRPLFWALRLSCCD